MIFTKIKYLWLLFIPISLFAYIDSDLDGVEDALDKCPDTKIIDLVNEDGCPVDSLDRSHHFDIILGVKSIKVRDKVKNKNYYLLIKNAQIGYLYKNFTFSMLGSKYNSTLLDTYFSFKYEYNYNDFWTSYTSLNIVLPTYKSTYKNNNTDYGISESIYYKKENMTIFGGYRFTFINDDDIDAISLHYKNKNSYTLGVGYDITDKLYSSISMSKVDSVYKNVDSSVNANLYFLYSFDDNWFTNASFIKTYNDSTISDTLSFKIGYYY